MNTNKSIYGDSVSGSDSSELMEQIFHWLYNLGYAVRKEKSPINDALIIVGADFGRLDYDHGYTRDRIIAGDKYSPGAKMYVAVNISQGRLRVSKDRIKKLIERKRIALKEERERVIAEILVRQKEAERRDEWKARKRAYVYEHKALTDEMKEVLPEPIFYRENQDGPPTLETSLNLTAEQWEAILPIIKSGIST